MAISESDKKWMQQALKLADKGAGYVSPNPMVGCLIVSKEGRQVGQGYHEQYGQAHAEANALSSVRDKAELIQATVYITLEPCSHHGKTPPCCQLLADLPIERVVVAMKDPNPKVQGNGIAYLRERGITVDVGVLEEKARRQNEFFTHYISTKKPFVTLKIAQTADGYTAAPDGNSKWITGEAARTRVHKWRSRYDGVMVGRGTAHLDNPKLTVRLIEGRQPRRIVVDGPYELPRNLYLFSDQHEEKTIVFTHNASKASDDADPMLSMLKTDYFRGKTVIVPQKNAHCDLNSIMRKLGDMEITSVLVESGQQLGSALLRENLVDKLELFIAPKLLGGGTRSTMGIGINRMSEVRSFRSYTWEQIGDDLLLSAYL